MLYSCEDGTSHSSNIFFFLSTYRALKRRCFSDNVCVHNYQENGERFVLVCVPDWSGSRRVLLLEPHLTEGEGHNRIPSLYHALG